ncbi:alpha/beta hydrolase family esterase, partial [Corynebacterium kefirresidentii]|uniref:alpha/beta hydrolase family esterase n=1 Tax=Corynebacterium kefirresidentii TaxID=1979527 RepID=UPI0037353F2B
MHVHRRTADVDGRARRFLVIAPDNLGLRPDLLLFFHGSLQSGNVMRRFTNGTFDELADATNTVLVYPDGVDRHFNDCRSILPVTARAENVDDVAFTAFLVEEMRREFGTGRTFACGYSNGGQMVLRLLFDAPFALTRACIFASTLGEGDNHAPSNPDGYRPTPLLFFHGTADPYAPYEGG